MGLNVVREGGGEGWVKGRPGRGDLPVFCLSDSEQVSEGILFSGVKLLRVRLGQQLLWV